ncbi:FRG domain-containing protein [Desulfosporosinus meridiei]|uniref:FRG domain protein n=1 Tax=Desulfosporosinus meridiei (strain ATCC BAA-275 / DSM 13257 / KCTC 12902 / NCIMB 13706 / S10) TaxID=768704 RepID=J7ITN0_DESMD|nr:FRG domain-containing protein [Desulfosporosinus meridiei]AFQ42458.1 FRG domain protein [Desulfosporosinus meridiei DSM 13257]
MPNGEQLTGPVTQCVSRINSVDGFLNAVDKVFQRICPIGRCELWYRGQNQPANPTGFNLTPSIARSGRNPLMEIIYLSKFKSYAIPSVQGLPSFPIPNGSDAYWHWLFMMQHYGVPTRLLDWSRDALTALFFALDGRGPNDAGKDAAVWILNPVRLNEAFSFHSFVNPGYIPNVNERIVNLYFGPNAEIPSNKKPAAVIGPLNNTHIVAQRGVFTLFPHDKEIKSLNLFSDASNYLVEICIAAESISLISEQLKRYGVTRFTLYPDITEVRNQIALEGEEEGQLPVAAPDTTQEIATQSVKINQGKPHFTGSAFNETGSSFLSVKSHE